MARLVLTEYRTEHGVQLDADQRDAMTRLARVSPTVGAPGRFDVTPGSTVGVVALSGLTVEIRPKIAISRLMFLMSYAASPRHWRQSDVTTTEDESILEAIALGFVAQVQRAVARGVLQGYRTFEDSLLSVRGRVRMEEQIRRHFGRAPPAEVRFDEFTEDTELNRILRAALFRLGRMRMRSDRVHKRVRAVERLFANVSLVEIEPRRLEPRQWNRLNERYRGAVEMALRILDGCSFDLGAGAVKTSAFLVDMNRVFEDFVVVALREALGVSEKVLVQGGAGRKLHLDKAEHVRLRPDISWWRGHECIGVADAKYKRLDAGKIKHGDLYQLLAYSVATGLPGGVLIYAKGERETQIHTVVELGKRLEIVTLDLSVSPLEILDQVAKLADGMRANVS